MFRAAISVVCI